MYLTLTRPTTHIKSETVHQPTEMTAKEEDTATVSQPKSLKLKSPMMNCSIEYAHREFTVLKTLAKMWLETKDMPHNKHCMFILKLLCKDGLPHWESFPPCRP